MFQYPIMTEEDALSERFQLLKSGDYDAVVSASTDKQSHSGNPMMDITLSVFDSNGKSHDIRDFLVFTPACMWKVITFAKSAGIKKEYDDGKLCSQIAINKLVKVKVAIEEGKEIPADKLNGKPMGTKYFDKNRITDYLFSEDTKFSGKEDFQDDETPF